MPLPRWMEPQLCRLATKALSGAQWTHEIKLDGYRMAARVEDGKVKLLTRSRLDRTVKYPTTAAAFAKLKVTTAYFDGEFCGARPDGLVRSANRTHPSAPAGLGSADHTAQMKLCRGDAICVSDHTGRDVR
jgi:ATP dependent DNA ligase domain